MATSTRPQRARAWRTRAGPGHRATTPKSRAVLSTRFPACAQPRARDSDPGACPSGPWFSCDPSIGAGAWCLPAARVEAGVPPLAPPFPSAPPLAPPGSISCGTSGSLPVLLRVRCLQLDVESWLGCRARRVRAACSGCPAARMRTLPESEEEQALGVEDRRRRSHGRVAGS